MPTDNCTTAGTFTDHNNASSCPAITNVSPEQAYIVNNETVSCTVVMEQIISRVDQSFYCVL